MKAPDFHYRCGKNESGLPVTGAYTLLGSYQLLGPGRAEIALMSREGHNSTF